MMDTTPLTFAALLVGLFYLAFATSPKDTAHSIPSLFAGLIKRRRLNETDDDADESPE